MSNDNFIKLTRLLSTDQDWIDARPTYQSVLICILLRMAFSDTEQNNDGHRVTIKKCQLYVSIRKLAEWSSKWITRDDVVGALRYFSRCHFLRHEIRQGKSLITVIHSDICKQFLNTPPTEIPTELRQNSDIKEEREERKEENIYEKAFAFDEPFDEGEEQSATDVQPVSDNIPYVAKPRKPTKPRKKKSKAQCNVPEEDRLRYDTKGYASHVWFQKSTNAYQTICNEIGEDLVKHFIKKINNKLKKENRPEDYYGYDYVETIRGWYETAKEENWLPKQAAAEVKLIKEENIDPTIMETVNARYGY